MSAEFYRFFCHKLIVNAAPIKSQTKKHARIFYDLLIPVWIMGLSAPSVAGQV